MTTAEKLQTIAKNEQKVYEAGRKSMVDESKIIEKSATDTGVLTISDVSEIPHDVGVKLSSDTITDFSGIEVKVQGVNILDFEAALKYWGMAYTKDGNSITTTASLSNGYNKPYKFTDKAEICTISVTSASTTGWLSPRIRLGYVDENGKYTRDNMMFLPFDGNQNPSLVITSSSKINAIELDHSGGSGSFSVTLNELMINYGTVKRGFAPYYEHIYTAESNGIVDGVKSLAPDMTFTSEGVSITANYHRSYGMQTEYDGFWDALQNCGNRTDYYYGFSGYSWTEKTFKPKYDIKGIRFTSTFYTTSLFFSSLIDILAECGVILDTSEATQITNMFGYSALSEVPHIDFSSVTSMSAGDMFRQCSRLKKIEKLTLKEGVTLSNSAFEGCKVLEEIEFAGVIGNSINLQWSTKLNKASIMSLINTLSVNTTGLTVTLSKTAVNNAFETSEGETDGSTSDEWLTLIATKSNWTISLV